MPGDHGVLTSNTGSPEETADYVEPIGSTGIGHLSRVSRPANNPPWAFWIGRGSLAVLDQGLIASSNFAMSILLARWLSPPQYGGYALAFAIFLLLSLLYQALVLEPQRIFGSTEHADHDREYLGVLLWMHLGLACTTALVLGGYTWAVYAYAHSDMAGALAGVTAAAPCVLLLWLARGAFYTRMGSHGAVLGSAIYAAVVLAGIFIVYQLRLLSAFSAFIVTAAGASISSVFLLMSLRPVWRHTQIGLSWRVVLDEHWQYGRWILVSSLLGWVTGDIYYPLVTAFSGLNAAGELRALQNFSMPITQALNALAVFVLPYAARIHRDNGPAVLGRVMWKISGLFALGAFAYWAALLVIRQPVIRLVYGSQYSELGPLLPWVAAASIPWTVAYVPAMALRAIRSSASVLLIYSASSVIALLLGIPATRAFGLHGALWTMLLSNLTVLVTALILVSGKVRTNRIGDRN